MWKILVLGSLCFIACNNSSDTSSNALFCKLQATTAEKIGVDPIVTVAANASGGVTGKMISPQSVATAAAAVGLAGKESDLFRFTVRHSLVMLFIISIIVMLQAYVFSGIIPEYEAMKNINAANAGGSGWPYLIALVIAVLILVILLTISRRRTNISGS